VNIHLDLWLQSEVLVLAIISTSYKIISTYYKSSQQRMRCKKSFQNCFDIFMTSQDWNLEGYILITVKYVKPEFLHAYLFLEMFKLFISSSSYVKLFYFALS